MIWVSTSDFGTRPKGKQRRIIQACTYISHIESIEVDEVSDQTCTDPESFVRVGPTVKFLLLFFFSLMRGGMMQIPLLAGYHLPVSEMPFKWCFVGVPIKAQH